MPIAPFRAPPIRIQPYFGFRNRDRLTISCRALRSGKRDASARFRASGRWQAFRTMISQFASREVADVTVELELRHADGRSHRHSALTDDEGYAQFDIALDPPADLSETTVWEVVTFHWDNREGGQAVDGHVLVPGRDAALGVISDIDDTVIETGITGNLRAIARNWRRVLMQMPDERLLVPQADVFYTALGGGAVLMEGDGSAGERLPATHHPFFYVSSSPWNLFSYLVAFMKSRKLPLGPLMLRDWGLNRETFGSGSHGAHKTEAIHRIIETYPDMRFALIGDDTQGDLVAFAKVVADHPGRIRAVFIRRAGDPFTPEEREAKATIESANVPLWLGDDYETGHQFLGSIGLSQDGEAEEIVRMVDRTGKGDTVAAEEGAI
ncbi:phosphatase domain-containing protein [Erythrobacter sp. A6_0]|uniref:App1 family protein n=1 Tax=Erythrobacter sp. A6_0 TaxID=2821089 RepID=UPI001ADB3CCD|nr:phosphatase domain-containing protein [Erythrobacter sp. A6_0]MBO9511845.1 DUF2183 domain-containing protein [Erythrobacter sp. A6_0]